MDVDLTLEREVARGNCHFLTDRNHKKETEYATPYEIQKADTECINVQTVKKLRTKKSTMI